MGTSCTPLPVTFPFIRKKQTGYLKKKKKADSIF
jgi:hypothetical protein